MVAGGRTAAGPDAPDGTERGLVLLTGMQAVVRALVDQRRLDRRRGLRTATFVSGYPGSPLAGLDLQLQRSSAVLAEHDITFVPGLNEELAATAVWGSQQSLLLADAEHDGVVGVWFGKAPGLDRAGDALRHANLAGVAPRGGAVAIVGDDPSAKSSSLPSRSEVECYSKSLPVLSPGNIQDVLDLGVHAVELSRYSGLWVALQLVTDVADSIGTAEVDLDRLHPVRPEATVDGAPWAPLQIPATVNPHSVQAERDIAGRLEAARRYAVANGLNPVTVDPPGARLGIIAGGKTYFDLGQAAAVLGCDLAGLGDHGARVMKLGLLWPLDPASLRAFATGLDRVLVIEEKQGFVETMVKDALYGMPDPPAVVGKRDERGEPCVPADGALDGERIAAVLGPFLGLPVPTAGPSLALLPVADAPPRTAFYCSGCPHNRSTVVIDGSVAGGGIGCHGIALRTQPGTIGITQMGGEGTQWIGRSPYTATEHIFQNVGDGTFSHSASLAVRACVGSGVNITFKLLYNSAIAMTGGQTPLGGMSLAQVVDILLAERVAQVVVVTDDVGRHRRKRWPARVSVRPREDLEAVQRELRSVEGVTVMVYDQECAAELRRKRKRGLAVEPARRVLINEAVCEGCGDCGAKSTCLSVLPVETPFGPKTRIDQSSCNKDYSCLDGDCPSFVTVTAAPVRDGDRPRPATVPELDLDLPEPPAPPGGDWNLVIAGIGGTGVVTVNHVLATAAEREGRHVAGLDQTGLSQKAGPVVSHLRVSDHPLDASTSVGSGQADLLLGFDLLVAADAGTVKRADRARTATVLSSSKVPTGKMVSDVGTTYPAPEPIIRSVARHCRSSTVVDALAVAEDLFHDHIAANMLLVGVAYQRGLVPMRARSIEAALATGVASAMNVAAFRWGRALVVDPDHVDRARVAAGGPPGPEAGPADHGRRTRRRAAALLAGRTDPEPLAELVAVRVHELVDYQGPALAARYLALVDRVRAREEAVAPGDHELSRAVARSFFKLLAYKDEYEVARLHLRPEFQRQLRAQGGRVAYLLHPPVLRALGMKRKIRLGRSARPLFVVLRALRRLRGTPLDPFGRAGLRRLERELVDEYEALVDGELAELSPPTLRRAVALAAAPDLVRGYEDIKVRNVSAYRDEIHRLRTQGAEVHV